MLSTLMAVLFQAAAPPVAPPPAAPRASVITNPDWLARPSWEDLAQAYPMAAARAEVQGQALLACEVNTEGRLVKCAVPFENPVGYGFGAAALSIADSFRMRPMTRDGVPVGGGAIRIPIRFGLPGGYETSPKRFRDPSFSEARVDLDCRFVGPRLDNCITVRAEPPGTPMEQVARDLTELMDMAPQRHKRGRIVIPMLFTPEPLPSKNSP